MTAPAEPPPTMTKSTALVVVLLLMQVDLARRLRHRHAPCNWVFPLPRIATGQGLREGSFGVEDSQKLSDWF